MVRDDISERRNKQQVPFVTVAMPIFNAGNYLRMAVLSIVIQTEQNWELLIIDDGSTDNALESIRDIKDSRIYIMQDGENKGLAQRLNEAIDLARGQYFARMDQDDVSYPERFERQIKFFQSNVDLDLLATRSILIDQNNQLVGLFPSSITHEQICARPWMGFHFPHPTWMGKTEWFRKFHYKVPGPYLCEDQEILLRSFRGSHFLTVDEILFAYRIKRDINLQKLFRTRKSVLKVQIRQFMKTREWKYILLAVAVLSGRLVMDCIKFLFQKLSHDHPVGFSTYQLQPWQSLLKRISDIEKSSGAAL